MFEVVDVKDFDISTYENCDISEKFLRYIFESDDFHVENIDDNFLKKYNYKMVKIYFYVHSNTPKTLHLIIGYPYYEMRRYLALVYLHGTYVSIDNTREETHEMFSEEEENYIFFDLEDEMETIKNSKLIKVNISPTNISVLHDLPIFFKNFLIDNLINYGISLFRNEFRKIVFLFKNEIYVYYEYNPNFTGIVVDNNDVILAYTGPKNNLLNSDDFLIEFFKWWFVRIES